MFLLAIVLAGSVGTFAFLQAVVPNPDEDLVAFAQLVIDAIQSRNYFLLASLVVIALVWAARKFLGARVPFLRTDVGGVVLSLLTSLGATVGAALLAGTPFSWVLLVQALGVAVGASGAFNLVKKSLGISGGGGSGASPGDQPGAPAAPPVPMPEVKAPTGALDAAISKADVSRQRGSVEVLIPLMVGLCGLAFVVLLGCAGVPRFIRGYQAQSVEAVFQAPLNDAELYVCTQVREDEKPFLLCDELSRVRERAAKPKVDAGISHSNEEL